jgi:hypothetical protein
MAFITCNSVLMYVSLFFVAYLMTVIIWTIHCHRTFFLEEEVPELTRGERTNVRKAL